MPKDQVVMANIWPELILGALEHGIAVNATPKTIMRAVAPNSQRSLVSIKPYLSCRL